MKYKKLYICIFLGIIYFLISPLPGQKLYKDSLNYVVELKSTKGNNEVYGTAFFIDNDGYLLTSAHLVHYKIGTNEYTYSHFMIRYANMNNYEKVELVAYDRKNDIAILKSNQRRKGFKLAKDYETGEVIYTIGNLNNEGLSITKGIISKKNLLIEKNELKTELIQLDLIVLNGSSGGVVLNEKGYVIGIISFRNKDQNGDINQGIAYAIPIDSAFKYYKCIKTDLV